MFDRTHRWMERWQLFDSPADGRSTYEQAVLI
jgi:hypothetical protein